MSPLIPFLLEQKPVPKVWGGVALETELGIKLPAGQAIGERIGEIWLLYDRPNESTGLAGGSETVRDLMLRDTKALLGDGVTPGYGNTFPLMLKFLDARERLSLQVHPDDAQARREGDSGKNEACVVLHAGPNARIVCGLRAGVTREQFEAAAHTAEVEELVLAFAPHVGDCIDVPTGTVHSFGPDVVVFEVEQNSDVTYRLYDWGRSREVQVDKALAATRHGAGDRPVTEPEPLADGGSLLVENEWFRLRRYELKASHAMTTGGRFLTVTVIGGRGTLAWHSGGSEEPLRLGVGDTVLVPACIAEVFLSPLGGLEVLVCDPGGR